MPSFFQGLAEQALSAIPAASADSSQEVRRTGGQEYNTPDNRQHAQGSFNTDEVLSHAESSVEDRGYIANAIQHVHDNREQHQDQVSEGDLNKYGPMIVSALTSVASKSGVDVGSLMSGGLGQGGGNQLMGLVMKHVGSAFGDQSGQDKQNLMNGAAMTLTKLVAQKQLSAFTGGANSGGLGGMLSMGQSLLSSRFG